MLAFETTHYFDTLGWLGRGMVTSNGPALLRRFGATHWDARGSWPYQSFPPVSLLEDLRDEPRFMPLTYTTVVRPDAGEEGVRTRLAEIRGRFSAECRTLKPHLGHSPDAPAARCGYSRRTRRRLDHAARLFAVDRATLTGEHAVLSTWQDRIKARRSIDHDSSPDAKHFAGLIEAFAGRPEDVVCLTLRWKQTGKLAGIFLLFADTGGGSWHAHSFLVDDDARSEFGTFYLFDAALDVLGDRVLWFGGAPSGRNGEGVFVFKQRFANVSAPARILCVDLNEAELKRVRSKVGPTPWLPNYRQRTDAQNA